MILCSLFRGRFKPLGGYIRGNMSFPADLWGFIRGEGRLYGEAIHEGLQYESGEGHLGFGLALGKQNLSKIPGRNGSSSGAGLRASETDAWVKQCTVPDPERKSFRGSIGCHRQRNINRNLPKILFRQQFFPKKGLCLCVLSVESRGETQTTATWYPSVSSSCF